MLKMMTDFFKSFKNIRVSRNALNCIFSASVSVAFALMIFTSSNPIWGRSGVDSASFILIGQGINKGMVPYVNFVDNKGLVLYVLNAIPQLIFKSTIGIWVLEVLFLFLSLRVIDSLANKLKSKSSFLLQILYLISISSLIKNGNMGEEYSSLFVLLAFLICLDRPGQLSKLSLMKKNIAIGALFALAFFIRPNNALPIFAIIICSTFYLLYLRKYSLFFENVLYYFLGFIIILAPILFYLQINNALSECINQTFLANLKYSGDSGNSPIELMSSVYGIKTGFIFLLSSMGVVAGYLKSKTDNSMRPFIEYLAIAVILSVYSSFISGFAYAHYLLINTAPMIISMTVLFSYLEGKKGIHLNNSSGFVEVKKVLTYIKFDKLKIISAFFALTLMLLMSTDKLQAAANNLLDFVPTLRNYIAASEPEGTFRSEMKKLTSVIPISERDRVYFIDSGDYSPDWYLQSGLIPAKRLFVASDRFIRLIPGLEDEYMDYFQIDPPLWIGMSYNLNGAPQTEINTLLNRKYLFVAKNNFDVFLYKHMNEE